MFNKLIYSTVHEVQITCFPHLKKTSPKSVFHFLYLSTIEMKCGVKECRKVLGALNDLKEVLDPMRMETDRGLCPGS